MCKKKGGLPGRAKGQAYTGVGWRAYQPSQPYRWLVSKLRHGLDMCEATQNKCKRPGTYVLYLLNAHQPSIVVPTSR
jgi:hypothetical protein